VPCHAIPKDSQQRFSSMHTIDSIREVGNREKSSLAITEDAFRAIQGLAVDLDLSHRDFRMSDEMWDAVCDFLKIHLTLRFLNICARGRFGAASILAPTGISSRTRALWDMMKVNIICSILLMLSYAFS
jgi:hypothetical protein